MPNITETPTPTGNENLTEAGTPVETGAGTETETPTETPVTSVDLTKFSFTQLERSKGANLGLENPTQVYSALEAAMNLERTDAHGNSRKALTDAQQAALAPILALINQATKIVDQETTIDTIKTRLARINNDITGLFSPKIGTFSGKRTSVEGVTVDDIRIKRPKETLVFETTKGTAGELFKAFNSLIEVYVVHYQKESGHEGKLVNNNEGPDDGFIELYEDLQKTLTRYFTNSAEGANVSVYERLRDLSVLRDMIDYNRDGHGDIISVNCPSFLESLMNRLETRLINEMFEYIDKFEFKSSDIAGNESKIMLPNHDLITLISSLSMLGERNGSNTLNKEASEACLKKLYEKYCEAIFKRATEMTTSPVHPNEDTKYYQIALQNVSYITSQFNNITGLNAEDIVDHKELIGHHIMDGFAHAFKSILQQSIDNPATFKAKAETLIDQLLAEYGQFENYLPLNSNKGQITFKDLIKWEIRKFVEEQVAKNNEVGKIIQLTGNNLTATNLDELLRDSDHFASPTNPNSLSTVLKNLQIVCQVVDSVTPEDIMKDALHTIHSEAFAKDLKTPAKKTALVALYNNYYSGKKDNATTQGRAVQAATQFLAPYLATVNRDYKVLGTGHPLHEDYRVNLTIGSKSVKKLELGISETLLTDLVSNCVSNAPSNQPETQGLNSYQHGRLIRQRQKPIADSIRLLINITLIAEGFDPLNISRIQSDGIKSEIFEKISTNVKSFIAQCFKQEVANSITVDSNGHTVIDPQKINEIFDRYAMLTNSQLISRELSNSLGQRMNILETGIERRKVLWNYISEVYTAVSDGLKYVDGRMTSNTSYDIEGLASGEIAMRDGDPQGAVIHSLKHVGSSTLDAIPHHDKQVTIESERESNKTFRTAQFNGLLQTLMNENSLTHSIDSIDVSINRDTGELEFEEMDEISEEKDAFYSGLRNEHAYETRRGAVDGIAVTTTPRVNPTQRASVRLDTPIPTDEELAEREREWDQAEDENVPAFDLTGLQAAPVGTHLGIG